MKILSFQLALFAQALPNPALPQFLLDFWYFLNIIKVAFANILLLGVY
jgi:hypothetical protein